MGIMAAEKIKIAFMASDAVALDSLAYLRGSSRFEVVCVLSNPDKPQGRGHKLSPNPVSAWALENRIELLRPEKSPDAAELERFRELGADMILVMAYGRILKDCVLNYSRLPCLNLHASLLPKLRGASPIETAVAVGDTQTGVSLMKISKQMDCGDVCAVEKISIGEDVSAQMLRKTISGCAAEILEKNLMRVVDGTAKFVPQNSAVATYARKLCKEDLFLDFRKSATQLRNRIRAFGCGIFVYENGVYKIGDARVIDADKTNPQAGRIVAASQKDGFKIECATGVLEVLKIQRPCAKMMYAEEFFKGAGFEKYAALKSADNSPLVSDRPFFRQKNISESAS